MEKNQEFTVENKGEIKQIIRTFVKEEEVKRQQKTTERREKLYKTFALLCFLLPFPCFFYYNSYIKDARLRVMIDRDKIYVKGLAGKRILREIKLQNNKWVISSEENPNSFITIFTPFESPSGKNSIFVFTNSGKLFWLYDDRTVYSEVTFIDNQWKYKLPNLDEWRSFAADELLNYDDVNENP